MSEITKGRRYVIQGPPFDDEDSCYWSNEEGWVEFDDATIFMPDDIQYLPLESIGLFFLDSDDFISVEEMNKINRQNRLDN